jgi:hypothetical protein
MTDYSKLRNFLSEQNLSVASATRTYAANTSVLNGFNSVKSSLSSFFAKTTNINSVNNKNNNSESSHGDNTNEQTDNWFREADSDPICPKLVMQPFS